eukprot:TRINITY_DN6274_c0_g2_i1.p1 TRINITY_DN6274_c0_g2~~TRINITY_DN6274_c0_g2_i1.p1  ORF type:complete len:312 (+),score=39.04 TRINITY_DN6274_c0_g2_i1:152-1087(+)
MDCPLCGKSFREDRIEAHVNKCLEDQDAALAEQISKEINESSSGTNGSNSRNKNRPKESMFYVPTVTELPPWPTEDPKVTEQHRVPFSMDNYRPKSSNSTKKPTSDTSSNTNNSNIQSAPTMNKRGGLLTAEIASKLKTEMPAKYQLPQYNFQLLYDSENHGISLSSLYNYCSHNTDAAPRPTILIIEDKNHFVFGAFISETLKCVEDVKTKNPFYGNGECFLFKAWPKWEAFHWTQDNHMFVRSNPKGITIGTGDSGNYGLWIDDDLLNGKSEFCETFGNTQLGSSPHFQCLTVQVYTIAFAYKNFSKLM